MTDSSSRPNQQLKKKKKKRGRGGGGGGDHDLPPLPDLFPVTHLKD